MSFAFGFFLHHVCHAHLTWDICHKHIIIIQTHNTSVARTKRSEYTHHPIILVVQPYSIQTRRARLAISFGCRYCARLSPQRESWLCCGSSSWLWGVFSINALHSLTAHAFEAMPKINSSHNIDVSSFYIYVSFYTCCLNAIYEYMYIYIYLFIYFPSMIYFFGACQEKRCAAVVPANEPHISILPQRHTRHIRIVIGKWISVRGTCANAYMVNILHNKDCSLIWLS